MKTRQLLKFILLAFASNVFAQTQQYTLPVKTIELVCHTHTDYGYTDNPIIAMDLHKRYIDIALDAIIETIDSSENAKFYWTVETLDPLYQWWLEASPERRSLLLKAIKSEQIDINALPFHQQALGSAREWNVFLNWVPQDLYKDLHPAFGMMNDVNGFPRTVAIGLLNSGINQIWMGINGDMGGSPFEQPSAFWWKMPDGRKILVWNGMEYWRGYDLFFEHEWRFHYRQTQANNPQFRYPRINDIFAADEKSVREANRVCIENIKKLVNKGYSYDFLALSFTNQWRCDNDGPFPPLTGFVKKWNQLGLQPAIHLTTASKALAIVEKKVGATIKTYEGEWPDWWTFGAASSPRDVSAARLANNYIEALLSPVWGETNENIKNNVYNMDKELCQFWEHTWAANEATGNPFGLFNIGHIAEKQILAYRPYEKSQWLLAQRIRNRFTNEPEGLYAANTGKAPYTGWIDIDVDAFRGKQYKSVIDKDNNKKFPLIYEKLGTARLWVENFEANKIKRYTLSYDSLPAITSYPLPEITLDATRWPVSCQWKGMDKPLFNESIGGFLSLESTVGRSMHMVRNENDAEKRKAKVKESTKETWAAASGKAEVQETPYTIIYKQKIVHPRLNSAIRKIEIWKNESRVKFSLTFDRISSANPEIFYVTFTLPQTDAFPVVSNGGNEFLPYKGQIPGTCTDFFTIDGWINYPSSEGNWIWSSRDMPLVSFGSHNFALKSLTPPKEMNKIYSMVYNNLWYVNFPDNVPGAMQFQYDLVWENNTTDLKIIPEIVQTYYLPPVIMLNPKEREDKHTFKGMNEIKKFKP